MNRKLQLTSLLPTGKVESMDSLTVAYKKKKSKVLSKKQKDDFVISVQSDKASISQICSKEGISISTFNKWTNDFLTNGKNDLSDSDLKEDKESIEYKFKTVIEGKSGISSVAQICRREGISHETFLSWSKEFLQVREQNLVNYRLRSKRFILNKDILVKHRGEEVFEYLENYVDFHDSNTKIFENYKAEDLLKYDSSNNIVCMQKSNDIRYINKYFETVNKVLKRDGIFVGCLETFGARRKRKAINRIPLINSIYFSFEFLIKRILPKLSFTKKFYFDLTKGNDRLLSKAEGLGRLVSCGFDIIDFKSYDGLLYFVVKKVDEPKFDLNPSYGPLYKMPRLGKNGKIIGVYKFRTMHPYSEYLQDYIVKAHGYSDSGKPADDFRIPMWGKFLRRVWLDELPQLINVLKGELKLVGVRPVSNRYFQDIPREMQKLRLTQKPGCVPPYVALNRDGNVMSVLQAEREYLEEVLQKPYSTDIRYFFKAVYNILINHKRSA